MIGWFFMDQDALTQCIPNFSHLHPTFMLLAKDMHGVFLLEVIRGVKEKVATFSLYKPVITILYSQVLGKPVLVCHKGIKMTVKNLKKGRTYHFLCLKWWFTTCASIWGALIWISSSSFSTEDNNLLNIVLFFTRLERNSKGSCARRESRKEDASYHSINNKNIIQLKK